jgi:hypothetical protein
VEKNSRRERNEKAKMLRGSIVNKCGDVKRYLI